MRKILVSILIIFISLASFSEFTEKNDSSNNENIPVEEKVMDYLTDESHPNPFLYNQYVGLAMDGCIYGTSTVAYLVLAHIEAISIAENAALPCITVPVGAVMAEKFVKNIILNGIISNKQNSFSNISLNLSVGGVTPFTGDAYDDPLPYWDILPFSKAGLSYIWNMNEKLGFTTQIEQYSYTFYPVYYSFGIGLSLGDYILTIDNVVYGKSRDISTFWDKDAYWKVWAGQFPGIGIAWSKKFFIKEGLFIAPELQFKFANSFSTINASLIGIFGGINLGYKF